MQWGPCLPLKLAKPRIKLRLCLPRCSNQAVVTFFASGHAPRLFVPMPLPHPAPAQHHNMYLNDYVPLTSEAPADPAPGRLDKTALPVDHLGRPRDVDQYLRATLILSIILNVGMIVGILGLYQTARSPTNPLFPQGLYCMALQDSQLSVL